MSVTSSKARNEQLTIQIRGDILSTNAGTVGQEIAETLKETTEDWELLILDLRTSKMVDSTGLNMLITVVKRMRANGKRLRLRISSPAVKRVFSFSRLDEIVEVDFKPKASS